MKDLYHEETPDKGIWFEIEREMLKGNTVNQIVNQWISEIHHPLKNVGEFTYKREKKRSLNDPLFNTL